MADVLDDGTLGFLPVRLNCQPVVMGGLTADEMWSAVLLSALVGFVVGIPLAVLTQVWALILGGALLGAVLGLTVASRVLRRMKRGRPDTWLYRHLQLTVVRRFPTWNPAKLITRTGAWTCQRTEGA
ncbi:conjugative transfer region protein, TIGR03750 family [Pseudomonas gessardii]|uniref:TIGR03750 family conjugal transfer protein n=1 Tax=Pseudomonas gessardii TaxID=78544 RepID=A0A7Y1MVB4_9PSED|nr:TIGR03750 family conjugal transfer protein [Pseudomonas gessardii]MRU50127.1 TIGR03750 family conjugal transfer protein [Pseudomonas gessardii]NNA98903.1 TIGR03750 family conjugal transfer protein [Pseudomonas gessardii]ONH46327.1 conjugal transfer protein [Pseudomonas gessardii]SDR33653.1 conjugative transfer region protein, TIGR03750 family [Pseudomonas gessardii]